MNVSIASGGKETAKKSKVLLSRRSRGCKACVTNICALRPVRQRENTIRFATISSHFNRKKCQKEAGNLNTTQKREAEDDPATGVRISLLRFQFSDALASIFFLWHYSANYKHLQDASVLPPLLCVCVY